MIIFIVSLVAKHNRNRCYIMSRWFDIPSIGVRYSRLGDSIYHGLGGQNTMGRRSQNIMGRGFNIPWVGGQNTMGNGVKNQG